MGRGELRVDTEVLSTANGALRRVASEFSTDDLTAQRIGDAVGHSDLAKKINHFSSMWKIERARMEKDITALSDVLTTTISAFEQAEESLADSLENPNVPSH